MKYLHDYLDNDWNIVKKKNTYVLKKNSNKMIVKADMTDEYQINYNNEKNTSKTLITTNVNDLQVPLKYILYFLYNTLNNGWTVKKKKDNYIFLKKHEGKKEYMANNYISTFIKEHFNYDLIKFN